MDNNNSNRAQDRQPLDTKTTTSGRRHYVDDAISAALLFFFLGLILIQEADFSGIQHKNPGDGDCVHYIQQADRLFSVRVNPFAFRNLSPLLVQLIKRNSNHFLGWDAAWYVYSFALVYGSSLLFYAFCCRVLRLSRSSACLAALMLLANWVFGRFQMQIPFFPDPLNNFLWMLAFFFLFTERWGWFHVAIGIGMLNKEVILFLTPLCPLFLYLKANRMTKTVWSHLGVAVALCGIYWAYRYGLGMYWHMTEYRLLSTNDWGIRSTLVIGLNLQKSIWHLFNTFGFLWVTFLLMLHECHSAYGWRSRFLLAGMIVFAICLFSRLYSTDVSRIFVMMAPLVVGLSVSYLDRLFGEHRFPGLLMVFFVILAGNQGWLADRTDLVVLNLAVIVLLFFLSRNAGKKVAPA